MFRSSVSCTLHTPGECSRAGAWVNRGIALMIVLNAAAVVLESVPQLDSRWHLAFRVFEKISMTLLALELLARLWSIAARPGFEHPVQGRLRYLLRPLTLIDLLVLATVASPVDLRALLTLRLFRLLHVLGLDRYSRPLRAIRIALAQRIDMLVIGVVMMLLLLFFAGIALYFVEHSAQPTVFSSIPAAFWWAVVSLTTTGYGDMVPITLLGRLIASVMLIFGVGIFAIPTAVIIAAVLDADTKEEIEALHRRREQGS